MGRAEKGRIIYGGERGVRRIRAMSHLPKLYRSDTFREREKKATEAQFQSYTFFRLNLRDELGLIKKDRSETRCLTLSMFLTIILSLLGSGKTRGANHVSINCQHGTCWNLGNLSGSLVGFSVRSRPCKPSSSVRQTRIYGLSGIVSADK
jgi:hypothetical protein